jgi:hypothetical protein
MARTYQATRETPYGHMKCLEKIVPRRGKKPLVARFGGIPSRRQPHATLVDLPVTIKRKPARNELLKRLLATTCELCQSTHQVEVHHIRKLADLRKQGQAEKPLWVRVMASRRRKTLIVCRECHRAIHAGKPTLIHTGLGSDNTIAITVTGNKLDLYVNGTKIDTASNIEITHGNVGFLAGTYANTQESVVAYREAKVWKLP